MQKLLPYLIGLILGILSMFGLDKVNEPDGQDGPPAVTRQEQTPCCDFVGYLGQKLLTAQIATDSTTDTTCCMYAQAMHDQMELIRATYFKECVELKCACDTFPAFTNPPQCP